MAGQEFKATEKTVLKHSRDGVVEKNLVDNSEKRVSKHTEEAVLKAETPSDLRFDKLQEAGIASPEPTKRKFSNLQFGRNNPENKWEEQRAEAKAEMSEQNLQPSEQISPSHKPRPPEQLSQTADYEFTPHSSEQFTTSEQPLTITTQEFKESQDFNLKGDDTKPVSALKEDKPTPVKRQFTENSPDEQYSTSDETVSVSADEFKDYGEDFNFKEGQPTDERSKDDLSLEKEEKQSKLKEKKERNTLQEHSSAAEKLTEDGGDSVLSFEDETSADIEAIPDKKTRKLEKKVEKAEKRLSKLEEKNDKKLPKLVKKDEKRVYKKKGLLELLEFLKKNNFIIALASSTSREKIEYYCKIEDMPNVFDIIVAGDEVHTGKPNPEIFLKACEKANVLPEHALVLEDSIVGIKAALKGNITPFLIPDDISKLPTYKGKYPLLKNPEEFIITRPENVRVFKDLLKVRDYLKQHFMID